MPCSDTCAWPTASTKRFHQEFSAVRISAVPAATTYISGRARVLAACADNAPTVRGVRSTPDQASMWGFCARSLLREYGWRFIWQVALPHPVRTMRAVAAAGALVCSGDEIQVPVGGELPRIEGARSIVGAGFCLKPLDPPCPSGRPNHDCRYLENLGVSNADVPAPCGECAIRDIGLEALEAGAAFYIMTSAKDILYDVFAPAQNEGRWSSGLFTMCRYSMRPFATGMLVSGISGVMVPFESGDCRDYAAWLRADRGDKDERTEIEKSKLAGIFRMLEDGGAERRAPTLFERRGNVLYPRTAVLGQQSGEGYGQGGVGKGETP